MTGRSKKPRDIAALIAFIDSRHAMPHAWGNRANDCISFGNGAVKAMTGRSALGRLSWTSKAGALRVLKQLGGVEAVLDARFERIPPAHARRGDIAGVPHDEFGIHPMIVEGATLVGPGDRGNRRLPRAAMVCAWDAETLKRPGSGQPRQPTDPDRKGAPPAGARVGVRRRPRAAKNHG